MHVKKGGRTTLPLAAALFRGIILAAVSRKETIMQRFRLGFVLISLLFAFPGCKEQGAAGEAAPTHAAETTAGLIKGPYVQNLSPTTASIVWEMDCACAGRADCTAQDDPQDSKARDGDFVQGVNVWNIEALRPGVSYRYRVSAAGNVGEGRFTTPVPGADRIRFIVYGDTRSRPNEHERVIMGMLPHQPEFVINTGDLVTDGTKYELWAEEFFKPAASLMRNVPLYPCLGNHEKQAEHYFNFFSLPGNERWYSFDWGNAHFICLDTNVDYGPESEQYKWLVRDLETSEMAAWKFVYYHHPMYSSNPKRKAQRQRVRDALQDLFFRHGVDMVFNGHDHFYLRTRPMVKLSEPKGGPIIHVVSGGGGAPMYDVEATPWTAAFKKALHFCVIDVNGPELEMKVYEPTGVVIDHLVLTKPYSDEFLASAYPVERATYADLLVGALRDLDLGSVAVEQKAFSKTLAFSLPNPLQQPVNGRAEWRGGSDAWTIRPRLSEFEIEAAGTADVAFELNARLPGVYPLPKLALSVETGTGTVSLPPQTPRFHLRRLVLCRPAASAPDIDGKIDENEWKDTDEQQGFVLDTSDALSRKNSSFRAAYDAVNLYLAFSFPEPEPQKLHAKAVERDRSQVWMDDCVEVFIDPGASRSNYFQLVLSASGAQFDGKDNDNSWNAEWTSAVRIGKDEWTCEMAVPFKSLGLEAAPKPGDVWGFNVCRNDNVSTEYSQWTTTLGSSHRPENFGNLNFAGGE